MSIDQEYKDFSKWCRDNPAYDLDPRLHTHSGRINDGGYILHKRTGTAFKAWQASRRAISSCSEIPNSSDPASRQDFEGEPIGYVVPRMLEAMQAGKYCGISISDEKKDGDIAVYTHPASADVPIGMSERLDVLAQGLKNLQRNSGSDVYQWGFVGAMLKDVQSMISDCVPQLEDRPTLGQRKAAQIGKE